MRNEEILPSHDDAILLLTSEEFLEDKKDGEILTCRYYNPLGEIKCILGIVTDDNSKKTLTMIDVECMELTTAHALEDLHVYDCGEY